MDEPEGLNDSIPMERNKSLVTLVLNRQEVSFSDKNWQAFRRHRNLETIAVMVKTDNASDGATQVLSA